MRTVKLDGKSRFLSQWASANDIAVKKLMVFVSKLMVPVLIN
jgi:hypothetical protein